MYKHILVAVDSSDGLTRLLDTSAHLASASGATVEVLHIVASEAAFDASADAQDDTTAEALASTAVDRLRAAGVPALARLVHATDSEIGDAILTAAAQDDADLIIIGHHRLRALDRWLSESGYEKRDPAGAGAGNIRNGTPGALSCASGPRRRGGRRGFSGACLGRASRADHLASRDVARAGQPAPPIIHGSPHAPVHPCGGPRRDGDPVRGHLRRGHHLLRQR